MLPGKDERDLLAAMLVCWRFGFTTGHLDLLVQLAGEDWHHRHEDVVSALDTGSF